MWKHVFCGGKGYSFSISMKRVNGPWGEQVESMDPSLAAASLIARENMENILPQPCLFFPEE